MEFVVNFNTGTRKQHRHDEALRHHMATAPEGSQKKDAFSHTAPVDAKELLRRATCADIMSQLQDELTGQGASWALCSSSQGVQVVSRSATYTNQICVLWSVVRTWTCVPDTDPEAV